MITNNRISANQRGQSLIEYVILVALVGVATMGMVRLLQKTVSVNLAKVIHTLQADKKAIPTHEHFNDRDLRKADFSDFMSNAVGHAKEHDGR